MAKIDFQKPEDIFIREITANFLLQNKDIEETRELALKIREIYRSHQVYFFKDEGEEIRPIWKIDLIIFPLKFEE